MVRAAGEVVRRSSRRERARGGVGVVRAASRLARRRDLPALLKDPSRLATLDGNFAAACWDGTAAALALRDPFGVRTLYYTEHAGVFYFASELKQLLAIPGLPIEVDPVAIHKYLTFSFVPGEDVPVRGIKRLLPGRVAVWENGTLTVTPYFALQEKIDPALARPEDGGAAGSQALPQGGREATQRRDGSRALSFRRARLLGRRVCGSSRPA